MPHRIHHAKREKAYRLRLDRKTLAEIAREVGVSHKTVSRWENGWVDAKGKKYPGWKKQLERAWQELAETSLKYGLILKEERIKAYEELARMAVNKVREMFPNIKGKTAADAKALLSEIRELGRLIAQEKGELHPSPQTVIAVKTDISLGEMQERYQAARIAETIETGEIRDADSVEGDAGPGRDETVALDD